MMLISCGISVSSAVKSQLVWKNRKFGNGKFDGKFLASIWYQFEQQRCCDVNAIEGGRGEWDEFYQYHL